MVLVTLRELPSLTNPEIENELPADELSRTETDDPSLANDLKDIALAKSVPPDKEILPPPRTFPQTETKLPACVRLATLANELIRVGPMIDRSLPSVTERVALALLPS